MVRKWTRPFLSVYKLIESDNYKYKKSLSDEMHNTAQNRIHAIGLE